MAPTISSFRPFIAKRFDEKYSGGGKDDDGGDTVENFIGYIREFVFVRAKELCPGGKCEAGKLATAAEDRLNSSWTFAGFQTSIVLGLIAASKPPGEIIDFNNPSEIRKLLEPLSDGKGNIVRASLMAYVDNPTPAKAPAVQMATLPPAEAVATAPVPAASAPTASEATGESVVAATAAAPILAPAPAPTPAPTMVVPEKPIAKTPVPEEPVVAPTVVAEEPAATTASAPATDSKSFDSKSFAICRLTELCGQGEEVDEGEKITALLNLREVLRTSDPDGAIKTQFADLFGIIGAPTTMQAVEPLPMPPTPTMAATEDTTKARV